MHSLSFFFVAALDEPEEGWKCGRKAFWCRKLKKCVLDKKKASCPRSEIEDEGIELILVSYFWLYEMLDSYEKALVFIVTLLIAKLFSIIW